MGSRGLKFGGTASRWEDNAVIDGSMDGQADARTKHMDDIIDDASKVVDESEHAEVI